MKTECVGSFRSFIRQTSCVWLVALLASMLLFAGCKDIKKKKLQEDARAAAAEQEAVARAVREHAQRLEQLRLEEERRLKLQEVPDVVWLDQASLHRPEGQDDATAATAATSTNDTAHDDVAAVAPVAMSSDTLTATTAANASVQPVTATPAVDLAAADAAAGGDLFTKLLLDQRTGGRGDDLTRAVNIAAILNMTGRQTFDARDLQPLSEPQRQRVQHYLKLTQLLRQQVLSPGGVTNYRQVLQQLDALMDEVPLHIRRVELSRSVSSFGVMQPLGTNTFLAGRPVPMIVYVELEHFKALKGEDDKYAVKLAQEMVLYNESDGLAVWREPRVQITDESLNRRRDFFVVQRIELPARLGVGKYLLKITMSDLQGGSIDEATLPIQIVADATLVKKP